jgi:DNA mismatch repair protein MutS2
MIQCGLLIPVSPDSEAGIFKEIFVDIGDQQSIENDLSTYSSHLKNMAHFLRQTSNRSLVLMDELGAGTDPNFGGSIAQAVLHGLLQKHAWGVATTHYYNLKLFAGEHAGIRNAAMRFDEQHLMPLYQLDIGKPGSSFALEIAQKTGLPEETLEEAQQLAGSELIGFESLVRNLEKEKNELSAKVEALEEQEQSLKTLLAKYELLTTDLEARKRQIIDKAKSEANELLRTTNREIEKTIRHIRENQAERKETLKVRKNLHELSAKVVQQRVIEEKIVSGELKVGRVELDIGHLGIGAHGGSVTASSACRSGPIMG